MATSEERFAAMYAELGESSSRWEDSLGLGYVLSVAHEHGILEDVVTATVLGEEGDTFLVSVEVSPGLYVHGELTRWCDVRPALEVYGMQAVHHVLQRLGEVASGVRAAFLREVATVVSAAVLPEGTMR